MIKINYHFTLSVFLATLIAQSGHALDIAITGDEDPILRICIEGETPERTDFSLAEQIDACTALVEQDNADAPGALFFRAIHFQEGQQWENALEDWNRLIELTPNNPSVWCYRSKTVRNLTGTDRYAIRDITRAIELTDPARPRPHYILTRALMAIELAIADTSAQNEKKTLLQHAASDTQQLLLLDDKKKIGLTSAQRQLVLDLQAEAKRRRAALPPADKNQNAIDR